MSGLYSAFILERAAAGMSSPGIAERRADISRSGRRSFPRDPAAQRLDARRAVVAELNHLLDLIVLDGAGMRENDQFPEQTERKQLETQYDHEGREQQRGPVGQRMTKKQTLNDEP